MITNKWIHSEDYGKQVGAFFYKLMKKAIEADMVNNGTIGPPPGSYVFDCYLVIGMPEGSVPLSMNSGGFPISLLPTINCKDAPVEFLEGYRNVLQTSFTKSLGMTDDMLRMECDMTGRRVMRVVERDMIDTWKAALKERRQKRKAAGIFDGW